MLNLRLPIIIINITNITMVDKGSNMILTRDIVKPNTII
jgi:hypothetical protein